MFCPNAPEWGNIADWVSGLGALGAIIVALRIAGSERRSAALLREIEANEDHARRAQVIAEAIRLAAEIEAKANSYAQLIAFGGGDSETRKHEAIADIEGIRSQLQALQQFPITDPRIFTEIGRMIHESRIERGASIQNSSYFQLTMRQVAIHMEARRNAISSV